MPKVSVIINVYNGEKTLRETIESVLAQTYTNWELIIWDDCSTDGSVEVAEAYDDHRIRCFRSEENRGLGISRFAALDQAEGEWVGYVDQDDLWSEDKLALQIELVAAKPNVGLVYGRTLKFYPNGKLLEYDHRHEFEPLPEGDIFERLFIDSCFIAIGSALFRRAAFASLANMPNEVDDCTDYYMYLAFAREYEVAAVQDVVCFYRIHAGNMSHTHGLRMQREILQIINSWSDAISLQLASRRHKVHSTVLAVHQLQSSEGVMAGLKTLLSDGAVGYLLSRPFARLFRAIRRRVRTPYWARPGNISRAQLIMARE